MYSKSKTPPPTDILQDLDVGIVLEGTWKVPLTFIMLPAAKPYADT